MSTERFDPDDFFGDPVPGCTEDLPDLETDEGWDPFGGSMSPSTPGYSIRHGRGEGDDDSPEAQGRRAVHHLLRLSQLDALKATRAGGLQAMKANLAAQLDMVNRDLKKLDAWFDEKAALDRGLLLTWLEEAPQFHEPKAPRSKTLSLTEGLAITSATKTTRTEIVLENEDAVRAQVPSDYVRVTEKLEWGKLKKDLKVVGSAVMLSGREEPVTGVYVRPGFSTEQYFAVLNGKKVPLFAGNGGEQDGAGSGQDTPDAED